MDRSLRDLLQLCDAARARDQARRGARDRLLTTPLRERMRVTDRVALNALACESIQRSIGRASWEYIIDARSGGAEPIWCKGATANDLPTALRSSRSDRLC